MRDWRGDEAIERISAELRRRLSAAALTVAGRAKVLLSVAGTGVRSKSGQVEPTPSGSRAKRIYGAFPSRPGEPPRKQTGRLRASVAWELAVTAAGKATARVGTNVLYGKFLELGTSRMLPRPWLRRALAETRGQVLAIFHRPFRPAP